MGEHMTKRWVWASLFLTGCLSNFDPFEEAGFLEDYIEVVCPLMADCADKTPDSRFNSPYADQALAVCESYVRDPNLQGCAVQVESAKTCYDEATKISDAVYTNQDCGLLQDWSETPGKACNVTYLNCVTDKPFGTLPFGNAEWN